jgi:ankyrin repeat protein
MVTVRVIVVIGMLFLVACDPGPLPRPPASPDYRDANYVRDSFGSDSDSPFPLDYAIRSDRIDEVRKLLQQGANPNLRWGQTGDHFPLQEVLDGGGNDVKAPAEMVRLLLSHGADPNAKWCPFESRAPNEWGPSCTSARGSTPLLFAAASGDREIVGLLLSAGADASVRDWYDGSALDYAYDEVIFEMICRALFPDITTRDQRALAWLQKYNGPLFGSPWQGTPLSRALGQREGNAFAVRRAARFLTEQQYRAELESQVLKRVRTLIRIGFDPNERLHYAAADWTPLGMAVEKRLLRVARLLLKSGADPNARWCVPFVSALYPFPPSYSHGAPSKARGCTMENGITPLIWSAASRNSDAVDRLLEFKADRSLKDWTGRSAVDYASAQDIRNLLATAEPPRSR